MAKLLEFHEQEDGSFISDPAPTDGSFEAVFRSSGNRQVLWSVRPNQLMKAGDMINLPSLITIFE